MNSPTEALTLENSGRVILYSPNEIAAVLRGAAQPGLRNSAPLKMGRNGPKLPQSCYLGVNVGNMTIVGLVFAASTNHDDIGYALAGSVIREALAAARALSERVPTGACVAG